MNVVFLGVYRTSSAGKRCMRFHLRWMSLHPVEAFACQLLEIEDDNIYWHVSCFTESYPKASVSTNFNGFFGTRQLVSQYCSWYTRSLFVMLGFAHNKKKDRTNNKNYYTIFRMKIRPVFRSCVWTRGINLMELDSHSRDSKEKINRKVRAIFRVACRLQQTVCGIWSIFNF